MVKEQKKEGRVGKGADKAGKCWKKRRKKVKGWKRSREGSFWSGYTYRYKKEIEGKCSIIMFVI